MLFGKQRFENSVSEIARVNVLCSAASGYSFSQVFKFSGPTAAHDVKLVAHELGHNFGSHHLPTAIRPPVDDCWQHEGGCFSGQQRTRGLEAG